jgi:hypothetical protein
VSFSPDEREFVFTRGDPTRTVVEERVAEADCSRLHLQEVVVTRASQHLDDAHSKLAQVQALVSLLNLECADSTPSLPIVDYAQTRLTRKSEIK